MDARTASGQSVLPSGRKTRALLACLALATPRPVMRRRLIRQLWSRSPQEQARASLRQEIQRLLDALSPAEADILIVARDHLALRPGTVSTDVQEVTRANLHRPETLSQLDADLLEDLEGVDPIFDAWLRVERSRLRNRALRIGELMLEGAFRPDEKQSLRPNQRVSTAASPTAAFEHLQEAQGGASVPGDPTTIHGACIGVMPLRVIGLPDEDAGLAVGLADEITNVLSRFRWISIVSPYSLERFAVVSRDGATIKQELGLDFLLDGSVQQASNKIRISLQLLDLRAKNQIVWARRFDTENHDLLSLQEEIAAGVAAQIDPEIFMIEAERRSRSRAPAEATADDLMLQAVSLIGRMEREPFMRAGQYFADAIALEPEYPQLYAWYAYWHIFLVGQDWADDPTAIMKRAGEMASRAVALDPFDARAVAVSGHVLAFLSRRLPEAIALHDRALSLNPSLAMAWALSAIAHAYAGNLEEAERRATRYKTLSPLDPHAFFFDAFFVLINLMKGDYEAAVAVGRQVVQLNPSFSAAYKPYLAALGHLRRGQEAEGVRQRLVTLEPFFTIERFLENNPLERECDRMHYAEGLRLAGIPTNVSVCQTLGVAAPPRDCLDL